jgi:SAM-dependent methyltransferase
VRLGPPLSSGAACRRAGFDGVPRAYYVRDWSLASRRSIPERTETIARIDRSKRSLGTALKRRAPSRAAALLVGRGLVLGRVLDYGCGHGFDAGHFGWDGYDPYYRPTEPAGPYDTVVCTLVLNTLSRRNRARVLDCIRALLADDGRAYLAVARNIPPEGKLGVNHCPQSYVVLTLPVVFEDANLAIYAMAKSVSAEDRTRDHASRRDRRRDAWPRGAASGYSICPA